MLTPRVFISSTYKDLVKFRQEVDDVCRSLKTESIIMDHFRRTEEPLEVCRQEIDGTSIFIGIYAFRYGFCPEGSGTSITEHEFDYAIQQGKKILCYLAEESIQQSSEYNDFTETDEEQQQLNRFKARIRGHSPRWFKSKEELGKWVAIDLGREYVEMLLQGGSARELAKTIPLPKPELLGFPRHPFKNLHHFNENDARIFFGRHQVITEIYQHLSSDFPKRVHLVFGQTGVGKSSVFDAGLLKRMEVQGWNVTYVRRPDFSEPLEKIFSESPISNTINTLIILDQLEELWTYKQLKDRQPGLFEEIALLTARHSQLFFMLGFRKEYLAEMEQMMNRFDLAHSKTLINPITRKEIVEAVWRIRLDSAFNRYYQLDIDDELPQMLAEDLTRDEESHIAPLLQITLSMMYREADKARKARNEVTTKFSKALYLQLKQKSLEDFVYGQIEQIAINHSQAVETGLVLDILHFFVTPLTTAGDHINEEWQARYKHLADVSQLMTSLVNRFLLLAQSNGYRLSHDALAPIVQHAYRLSNAPGQQAARILDSKQNQVIRFGTTETVFSTGDLRTLGEGKTGMRIWTETEQAAYIFSMQTTNALQRTLKKRQKLAIQALSTNLAKDARLAFGQKVYSSAVRLAEKALEIDPGNNKALEALINFYHHLPILAEMQGHHKHTYSAVFSPDGRQIITASADYTARLWDDQGRLRAILVGHQHEVVSALFSPNGNLIITASLDKTARLWDKQGRFIMVMEGHHSAVNSAVFSPDGSAILTASSDKTARLWNLQGTQKAVLEGKGGEVISAVFSPDGNYILTATSTGSAYLWDNHGQLIKILTGHRDTVNIVTFSPDGSRMLTASWDKTARLWDLQGEMLAILENHQEEIISAQFSPKGSRILIASYDGNASVWDAQGNLIKTLNGHAKAIASAAFSPDGKQMLTASWDKTVRLWDSEGSMMAVFEGLTSECYSVVFSPDGSQVLAASMNGHAYLWDSQGRTKTELENHQDMVFTEQIAPNGNYIHGFSTHARLLDSRLELIAKLEENVSSVELARFSPDGRHVRIELKDGTVGIWLVVPAEIIMNFNAIGMAVLTWRDLLDYDINLAEQAAGINRVYELLSTEPHEMSLYHYAHYYYEIAQKQSEVSSEYLAKSLRLYDRLIEHWPLYVYKEERENALTLLNSSKG